GGGTLFTSSKPGHYLVIKPPCTGISLRTGAHQIFIAGGSGASGLLQLAQDAAVRQKLKVEFHHAIRQSKGLRHLMSQALHDNYYCYESENNIRMNIKAILKRQPKDTHIYACGPLALLIDVIQSTHELNRPLNQVHWDKAFDTVLLKKIRGFIHRSPREKWGSITSTDRTSLQS
ncbi:MAG: hypothetical protein KGL58_07665, partial [Pseudomonadota bacterium]|nr:hypothetical protein [Pseudomonadota bacterium]